MKSHPPIRPIAAALVALATFLCASPALADEASPPEKADVDDMLKIGVPEQIQASDAKPNDPLPRVLLLGDSIAGAYAGSVSSLLRGKAFVQRGNNGGPSTAGLKGLDAMLGDEPWDVIHFNWGLHDMTFQTRMTNPLFPRLRSGHWLFQRPSPQKQIPSNRPGPADPRLRK